MNAPAPDRLLPALLLAVTAVTGFVDAVSFMALGHVFTANKKLACAGNSPARSVCVCADR
jgi:hypothetical protein